MPPYKCRFKLGNYNNSHIDGIKLPLVIDKPPFPVQFVCGLYAYPENQDYDVFYIQNSYDKQYDVLNSNSDMISYSLFDNRLYSFFPSLRDVNYVTEYDAGTLDVISSDKESAPFYDRALLPNYSFAANPHNSQKAILSYGQLFLYKDGSFTKPTIKEVDPDRRNFGYIILGYISADKILVFNRFNDNEILVLDSSTGNIIREFDVAGLDYDHCMATLSFDGKYFVIHGDNVFDVYKVEENSVSLLKSFSAQEAAEITKFSFHPNNYSFLILEKWNFQMSEVSIVSLPAFQKIREIKDVLLGGVDPFNGNISITREEISEEIFSHSVTVWDKDLTKELYNSPRILREGYFICNNKLFMKDGTGFSYIDLTKVKW